MSAAFSTLLASLAFFTLRSDALVALAEATSEWTDCNACGGHGERPSPHSHHPADCISCHACQGRGERVVSPWDEDVAAAHRAVLAATLVDRSGLPAARAASAALSASLTMTVRRTLSLRGCPCCHELRDARAFEEDGACERCHIALDEIAAEQHASARAAFEAELEHWPVAPPDLPWQRDAEQPFALAAGAL